MKKDYVPSKGDIVWLDFDPQLGREQSGLRPALIISPISYNKKVGLALICPITSHEKGYPFEVKIPEKLKISGVILSDHVKSLDWKARNSKFIDKIPKQVMEDVIAKISSLIDEDE